MRQGAARTQYSHSDLSVSRTTSIGRGRFEELQSQQLRLVRCAVPLWQVSVVSACGGCIGRKCSAMCKPVFEVCPAAVVCFSLAIFCAAIQGLYSLNYGLALDDIDSFRGVRQAIPKGQASFTPHPTVRVFSLLL